MVEDRTDCVIEAREFLAGRESLFLWMQARLDYENAFVACLLCGWTRRQTYNRWLYNPFEIIVVMFCTRVACK